MITEWIIKPYDIYTQVALVLKSLLYKYNEIHRGDAKKIYFLSDSRNNSHLRFHIIRKMYYFATFKVTVPSQLGTILQLMKAAVLKQCRFFNPYPANVEEIMSS